jgi:hypothetical protein
LLASVAGGSEELSLMGSNQLEYAWEAETRDGEPRNEELVNFLDLDARYGNFLLGGRLELYQPVHSLDRPSVGFERISKRYLEYELPWLKTRIGHYYATFGRGVVLRSFDNEELRRFATPKSFPENIYDTGLDGIRCAARWRRFDLTLLSGRREREGGLGYDVVHGADLEVETGLDRTRVGVSAVRARTVSADPGAEGEREWLLAGGRAATYLGPADLHVEYARQIASPWSDEEKWGSSFYVGSNLFIYGVGASIELKDYRAADFPYSSPPTCNRSGKPLVHDVTHEREERGWQAELSWSPFLGLGFVANHAWAETRDGAGVLKESFLEGRWDVADKGAMEINWERLEDNLKVENAPTVEITYYVSRSVSVSLSGEREWNSEWRGYQTHKRWEEDTVVLSVEILPSITVTNTFEHTTSDEESHKNWLFCQLGFHLSGGHEVSLAYGRQRGGLKCSSGVCRWEPEFDGARLSLTLRI